MALDFDLIIILLYGTINIVILIPTAWIIYHKDKDSNVNRGISYGMLFGALALVFHSLRPLIWDIVLFEGPGGIIFKRAEYFSIAIGAALLFWSSMILRDGEALWNRTKSSIFFVFVLTPNLLAVLTPDAFYVLPDMIRNQTGEGFLLSIIFYPSMVILSIAGIYNILSTYWTTKDDDPILNKQATRLAIGNGFLMLGAITALIRTMYIYETTGKYFVLLFITIGVLVLASGFSQETSLLKVKILSTLKRLSRCLVKGKARDAEKHLKYLTILLEEERTDVSITKVRILEALMEVYQTNLSNAIVSLESAKLIAKHHGFGSHIDEIDGYLEDLREREFDMKESDNYGSIQDEVQGKDDLKIALAYLDEIIKYRMGYNEN